MKEPGALLELLLVAVGSGVDGHLELLELHHGQIPLVRVVLGRLR